MKFYEEKVEDDVKKFGIEVYMDGCVRMVDTVGGKNSRKFTKVTPYLPYVNVFCCVDVGEGCGEKHEEEQRS